MSELEQNKPVIVIADTHLGLRCRKLLGMDLQSASCEPEILSGFLRWLADLQEKGSCVLPLAGGEDGKPFQFRLEAPSKLILLGDILELWDSSERALDACSRSILDTLSGLQCEKIYLIGNHDNLLSELSGSSYPCGAKSMLMTSPTYPPQTEKSEMQVVQIGDAAYLFLHGQQFDKLFIASGSLDRAIGFLRDGAVAFGEYSYFAAILFIAGLVLSCLNWLPWVVTGLLAFLGLPRIIIWVARPLFNKIKSRKYDRKGAIEGFGGWWSGRACGLLKGFSSGRQRPKQHMNVVYGHTHLTDIIDDKDMAPILGENFVTDLTLINISSWVRDSKHEDVLRASFLYIYDKGYEFFGWDWRANCPRHISKEDTRRRARGESTSEMVERLASVGWSAKMLDKWRTPLRLPRS
ncbi:MAG: hypothetical protein WCC94_09710 [Candidatus Bathyarchaeia archaeon]